MKKRLLSLSAVIALSICSSMNLKAQDDTLSSHFTGTIAMYGVASPDAGYVGGSNTYGDKAKMQLFDPIYGVNSTGTIKGVVLGVATKANAGGTFKVAIWEDNNGTPATTPLVSKTITVASVDTAIAAFSNIGTAGVFNLDVTFNTPVAIPSNNKFWAGVILPTTAGDSISLFTNTEGDFADATTHTGEIQSNNAFHTFSDGTQTSWGSLIALAIFPKVHFGSTTGLNEFTENSISVYPSPANEQLNFTFKSNCESIEILSTDGKLIKKEKVAGTTASINVSSLTSGIYLYKAINENGSVITDKFVKK